MDLSGTDLSNSATGTRTRVARVRAEYPNQLDYSGDAENLCSLSLLSLSRNFIFQSCS